LKEIRVFVDLGVYIYKWIEMGFSFHEKLCEEEEESVWCFDYQFVA